jgi:hypothetical protein
MKPLFISTLIVSLLVQIITGIIEIAGLLFVKVPSSGNLIRQLLLLEVGVQAVEGTFYFWLISNFSEIGNITPKRYLDWSITTPTMLITLVCYLIYLQYREKGEDTDKLTLFTLLAENTNELSWILGLNWMMLLFGYLGEEKIITTLKGVVLGFIPFIIYYGIIYFKYARYSTSGWKIFSYFFVSWSLYGVAATFSYYVKNSAYNILDLFSKNFFGIFLSYIIFTGRY